MMKKASVWLMALLLISGMAMAGPNLDPWAENETMQSAVALYDAGEYEECLSLLLTAEDLDISAKAAAMTAECYGQLGDEDSRMEWLTKGAALNSEYCIYHLAMMYHREDSPLYDEAKAVEWYMQGLILGDEYSIRNLAITYKDNETDRPYSSVRTISLLEMILALEAQDSRMDGRIDDNVVVRAQELLGDLYSYVDYGVEDVALALSYYQQAAEAGSVLAMNRLGHMYSCSEHGIMDTDQAVFWYEKAAALGDEEAAASLESLLKPE